MFYYNKETKRINEIINKNGQSITELEFFTKELQDWLRSPIRQRQLDGRAYYLGKHDILKRKRTSIGRNGEEQEVKYLPNNKIVCNQYGRLVEQKTNYLLGKPVTFSGDDAFIEEVKQRFNSSFLQMLKNVYTYALNEGGAWIYPYYLEGVLSFKLYPASEILPFWKDEAHTTLDAAIRFYELEAYEGTQKKIIKKVEIFKPDGLYRYSFDGSILTPDIDFPEFEPYIVSNGDNYAWERLPLVFFRCSVLEKPLLSRVKSLQDALNNAMSDFVNASQEDIGHSVVVLKNYPAEDPAEFRKNLASYGFVKVEGDGDVSVLRTQLDVNNYIALIDLLKRSIIEAGMGYDVRDANLKGSPNQMNIQSIYNDIDLDAAGAEAEFQSSLRSLLWFVVQDIKNQTGKDFSEEEIRIVFDKDVLINETETITNLKNSYGILSQETLLEQHPWTVDAKTEKERIEREKQADIYEGAF